MKRMLLAGLLATTAFTAFAANKAVEKAADKKAKQADCCGTDCCGKSCCAKSSTPEAPKK